MCRFIETIRLENGTLNNLNYHQIRIDRAFNEYFSDVAPFDLHEFLSACPMPAEGLHKVRLVFDREVQSVLISMYAMKKIETLRIVRDDTVSYHHKFENRTELNNLFSQRGDCDDIIIVKNNYVTDTSMSNIVFKRDNKWFTPTRCLLKGTMRQQLLDNKIISEEEITFDTIKRYEKVKLINAMLLFDGPEIDVSRIVD